LWVIFALLEPDPGTPFIITGSNTDVDLDPKHWFTVVKSDGAPGAILLFEVQAKDKKDIGQ
jgi:hypothetical protein